MEEKNKENNDYCNCPNPKYERQIDEYRPIYICTECGKEAHPEDERE